MDMDIYVSLGVRGLSWANYSTGRGWALNQLNASNQSCTKQVDDADLKDGRIPAVLGINIAVWAALVFVFLVIRYCASDYSRVGLVTSKRWARVIYNREHGTLLKEEEEARSESSPVEREDAHWYTWIVEFFFKLGDGEIRRCCGPDASLYLALERYLIVLLSVISVLSLLIILPINYLTGELQPPGFPRTTVSNLAASSGALWAHTLFSLVYLVITGVFMIHYSMRLGRSQQEYSNHTAMVQWIPSYVHREDIWHHFQEALPNAQVADLQLAYNVSKLTKLSKKVTDVKHSLDSVESISAELGKDETVRVGWGKLCYCYPDRCCNSTVESAHDHYESQLEEVTEEVEREKSAVANKKLGIGFVTFNREKDATDFINSYKIFRQKPKSSMYDSISARWWWVSVAPFPLDILWENLSIHYVVWWLRWLLINTILFVIIFFFTTPSIILASIDQIRIKLFNETKIAADFNNIDPLVKVYLSNLLLLLFALLLPVIVYSSCYLEAHWSKSSREQTIIRKTYIFLMFMVVFLPSVGLTSLNALGELATKGNDKVRERLQCIFLPNNGAFFISYVILSAFIATSVELLRIPELVVYVYRRLRAKTRLQREQALKKASQHDFLYGVQYAWNLVIFTMVMAFSLNTPIIVPFGVLYFILKYYTDKYNIYYVYQPASFNGRQFLHRTAIRLVIVGAIHLQIATLFYSIVRLGKVNARGAVMIAVFTLTCLVFIGFMFFGWFSHLLPQLRDKMGKEKQVFGPRRDSQRKRRERKEEEEEEGEGEGQGAEELVVKGAYIPDVLKQATDGPRPIQHESSVNGYQSFGSTDRMGRRSPCNSPPQRHSPTCQAKTEDSKSKSPESQSSADSKTQQGAVPFEVATDTDGTGTDSETALLV